MTCLKGEFLTRIPNQREKLPIWSVLKLCIQMVRKYRHTVKCVSAIKKIAIVPNQEVLEKKRGIS